ncbi:hypothetical protein ACOME3_007079 [Neoechinorhynchus agilis]
MVFNDDNFLESGLVYHGKVELELIEEFVGNRLLRMFLLDDLIDQILSSAEILRHILNSTRLLRSIHEQSIVILSENRSPFGIRVDHLNCSMIIHMNKANSKIRDNFERFQFDESLIPTGLNVDVVQAFALIPTILSQIRFFRNARRLEDLIEYRFKNPLLLQLALTHPSCSNGFLGSDTLNDTLCHCGLARPQHGNLVEERVSKSKMMSIVTNTKIDFNSQPCENELFSRKLVLSGCANYERLEHLGDAIIEYLISLHIYLLFPNLKEGSLSVVRSALVQNAFLAKVSIQNLMIEHFILVKISVIPPWVICGMTDMATRIIGTL